MERAEVDRRRIASAGDARARDWVAEWLLGLESRLLTVLAAEESASAPETAADSAIEFRRRKLEDHRQSEEPALELSELLNGR